MLVMFSILAFTSMVGSITNAMTHLMESGTARTVRLFMLILGHYVKGPILFDSDDISSFGIIFDAVKDAENVVAILSGEALHCSWRVGEVVTAYQCMVLVQPCTMSNSYLHAMSSVDMWQRLSEH